MPRAAGDRSAGQETRERILEACLQTLRTEGFHGASARAIGRTGDFNPALIFYHFDSVENALFLAANRSSEERVARYRERLRGITSIGELVGAARELHAEDAAEGNITVLTQMMAGAAGSPELTERMRGAFDPWLEVVEDALQQVVGDTPFDDVVDLRHLAFSIASMFLGIELLTHLERREDSEAEVFDALEDMSQLVEGVLELGPVASRALRRRLRRST